MVPIHRVGINCFLSSVKIHREVLFSQYVTCSLWPNRKYFMWSTWGKKGRQGRTRDTKPPWEDMKVLWFSSSISWSTYSFQPECEHKGSLLLFPPQKHLTERIPIRLQSNEERRQWRENSVPLLNSVQIFSRRVIYAKQVIESTRSHSIFAWL